MYPLAVASSTLVTVSLTHSMGTIDFGATTPIRIEWPKTVPGLFHLQGTRIASEPYDLDVKPSPQPWFEWPTSEIRKIKPSADQIGFLVWSRRISNGRAGTLYFPVRVSQGNVSGAHEPRLTVVPGTQLAELTLSIWPADENGQISGQSLGAKGPGSVLYPANQPIVLRLDALTAAPAGFYLVEVKARASNGMHVISLPHWLYHEP